MNTYHKIQTLYVRHPDNPTKVDTTQYSKPEFKYLANNDWYMSEKIDGCNLRLMYDNSKLSFGGKTDKAQLPAQLITHLIDKYMPLEKVFREQYHDQTFCLYGEGYGGKIQKGNHYRPDPSFVLFDILWGNKNWSSQSELEEFANEYDIPLVPIVRVGPLKDMVETLVNGPEILQSQWGPFPVEGLVAKPLHELRNRWGERVITKLKVKDLI